MLLARTALIVSSLVLPLVAADAQRRPAPSPGGLSASASELLDARRALALTPRQVARLDSIERAQFTQRRTMLAQLRMQRDSACGGARRCEISPADRGERRAAWRKDVRGPAALWKTDSVGRALAMSLLDSTQRGRVQGWRMAERRGRVGGPEFGRRDHGPRSWQPGAGNRGRDVRGIGRGGPPDRLGRGGEFGARGEPGRRGESSNSEDAGTAPRGRRFRPRLGAAPDSSGGAMPPSTAPASPRVKPDALAIL